MREEFETIEENIDEVEELILNNIKEAISIELVRQILEEFETIEENIDEVEELTLNNIKDSIELVRQILEEFETI